MHSDRMRRLKRGFQRASAASAGIALALQAAPVLADPLSEPERGMDAPVSQISTKWPALAVAAGGDSNNLIVWFTSGQSPGVPMHFVEVRGARVHPNGSLIGPDKHGFSLGFVQTDPAQGPPLAVAFGGGSYVVTWTEAGTIRASLVPADGDLNGSLMPESVVLDASITGAAHPAVTFDSAAMQFLITWFEGPYPPTSIRGMRVSAGGGALTPGAPFTIADLSAVVADVTSQSVTCSDAGCLLTFAALDGSQIYGSQIEGDPPAPNLFSIDALNPQLSGGSLKYPGVAFDGASYLVVWGRTSAAGEHSVVGARVDKSGAVLDPGGALLADDAIAPRVDARAGSPPLVAWIEPAAPIGTVRASRVDTSGPPTALDPGGVPVRTLLSSVPASPLVVTSGDGSQGLIVMTDAPDLGALPNILVSSAKVSAGPLTVTQAADPISKSWNHQIDPAVVWIEQAKSYLAVWKDSRSESVGALNMKQKLVSAILSESGQAVSFHDLSASMDSEVETNAIVAAAAGTANTLVAWVEYVSSGGGPTARVRGLLVSHDGKPLSTIPIDIIEDPALASPFPDGRLSVTFDGSAYVLIAAGYTSVRAVRVSASGAVLKDATIYEGSAGGSQSSWLGETKSAYGGSGQFMTVWIWGDGVSCKPFNTSTSSIHVPSESPIKIGSVPAGYASVAVAYGGGSYLAVWASHAEGGTIFGTRLSPSCERLDGGFVIADAEDRLSNLSVVFDGATYLVVWQDNFTTYGKWVSRDGGSLEQVALTVAGGPGFLGSPTLASSGKGRSLVAYSRSHFADSSGLWLDVPRARARIVNNDCAFPSPIECKSETPCFGGGECNPATKECTAQLPLPDGALCEDGLCIGGLCFEDPATSGGPAAGASGGAMNNGSAGTSSGCGCKAAGGDSGAALGSLFAVLLAAFRGGRRRARRSPRAHAVHLGAVK